MLTITAHVDDNHLAGVLCGPGERPIGATFDYAAQGFSGFLASCLLSREDSRPPRSSECSERILVRRTVQGSKAGKYVHAVWHGPTRIFRSLQRFAHPAGSIGGVAKRSFRLRGRCRVGKKT